MSNFNIAKYNLFKVETPNEQQHCDISPLCNKQDSPKESQILHTASIENCSFLKCKYCNKQYKLKVAYNRHLSEHYRYK